MNILQNQILPNIIFSAPEEMYVRLSNNSRISYSDDKIYFDKHGKASFDTFFNGFTVKTWREHCNIENLNIFLKGRGKFSIRICVHQIGCAHRLIEEHEIFLKEDSFLKIEIQSWPILNEGMLYYEILCLEEGYIGGGYFGTTTPPPNKVKIGIVITHFDRKKYVLPAIERIRKGLLDHQLYHSKFDLIVVDNSKNILESEASGATVIPNKNLGGSGGFMRGLLHLKDSDNVTHCLFMDDDASCEIESLCRTHSILSYASTSRFAVAGSLLREVEPYRLFEKGARFDGFCRPNKSGMDMRHVFDLLLAERKDQEVDYGGWWFFAFAIKDVREYAFPFFVRGDDIGFCLANKFNILTLNGISCWSDDFSLKSGPMTHYLDTRNHLIHSIVNCGKNSLEALAIAKKYIITQLYSHNYASARAINLALVHVMQGPDFFMNNIDLSEVRKHIASFSDVEKMKSIDRFKYNLIYKYSANKKSKSLLRKLTLNGFLLPKFMIRNRTVFQHKSFNACPESIYGYNKVMYVNELTETGYVAIHDKRKFLKEIVKFVCYSARFILFFNGTQKIYKCRWSNMTSESFWRKIYTRESSI